ncbi:inositol monophosphatase family protein [Leptolyngbya sp. PCC 6406]|uniref:inositol monophosphatase family protein n=1 Tax=Leptolyngbya sp. PCC 6406 TaxID=1173264 RepID=UPI0002ABBE1C|nr:inositol monophosphatase family protein [Leptolyngbya sp. PCC 6406]
MQDLMQDQVQWDRVLDVCHSLTDRVATQLLAVGNAPAEEKQDGSLVTQFDTWADEQLRTGLQTAFPDHGILSEETHHVFPDQDWCWIIDPIDGTTNFSRGIPLWAISLGLLYRGTPVYGYIYLPPLGDRFHGYWAGTSGLTLPTGAFLNNRPIHTRPDDPSANQFFSLCARSTSILQRPFPCKVRMLGTAAYNLLLVAAGYAVGAVEATPKVWDIAGVWPILQAAGATWTPLDEGDPFPLTVGENYRDRAFPTLITSRADLVDQFRPLVQGVIGGG